MFKWGQIEAVNEALTQCRDTLSASSIDELRRLSLQLGMMIVSQSQKTEQRPEQRLRTFGSRLRVSRVRARMTQEELGKACKVSKQSVYAYESGDGFPSLDTFVRLCGALNTTPDYLLGWGMETAEAAGVVSQTLEELGQPSSRKVDK